MNDDGGGGDGDDDDDNDFAKKATKAIGASFYERI